MKRGLSETSLAEVEWLKELPDELDVCIAQRDFDTAIELLFEGIIAKPIEGLWVAEVGINRNTVKSCSDSPNLKAVLCRGP